MSQRKRLIAWFLLVLFVSGGAVYMFFPSAGKSDTPNAEHAASTPSNLTYTKEGEVTFWKDGKKLRKIDVEIAENEAERAKGLMFRPYIPDSVGMLFIFNESVPQGFWMKNTAISLDIIYVDENKKIVSIAKNTKPYSEESIPSLGNAQYVVEVNAGFTERNHIKTGDAISF
jgi:uncharacterized membrane protein (UPF0127 family)